MINDIGYAVRKNEFTLVFMPSEIGYNTLPWLTEVLLDARNDGKRCEIWFAGHGGDINCAFSVADIIKLFNPIDGVLCGQISITEAIAFSSCSKRYALPNSSFSMIANNDTLVQESSSQFILFSALEVAFTNEKAAKTLSEVTNKDANFWVSQLAAPQQLLQYSDIIKIEFALPYAGLLSA